MAIFDVGTPVRTPDNRDGLVHSAGLAGPDGDYLVTVAVGDGSTHAFYWRSQFHATGITTVDGVLHAITD